MGQAEQQLELLDRLTLMVVHVLSDPTFRAARAAVNRELVDRFATGRIFAWLGVWLVRVLAAAFVVNDGMFMYTTARKLFDVPSSVPAWGFGDANNAFAVGVAVLFTTALLGAVTVGGKTLAWVLYPRTTPQDKTQREPGADGPSAVGGSVTPRSELDKHIATVPYLLVSVLVLAVLSVALHQLSERRFSGGLFAASTTTSTVYGWIVTLGPTVLWILTTIGDNPRFVHVRDVRRQTRSQKRAERRALRSETRLKRRYRAVYTTAERKMGALQDRLDDVGLGADWDWVGAARVNAELPMRSDTDDLNASAPAKTRLQDAVDPRKVAFTGVPESRFLPWIPHTGQRVRTVMIRFNLLPAPSNDSPIARLWQEFKTDPVGFEPVRYLAAEAGPSTGTPGPAAPADTDSGRRGQVLTLPLPGLEHLGHLDEPTG